MAKSSWGTQQEVYLNPKQLSDMYQVSWETVIGYIYKSKGSRLKAFHCIDCTKKKYPAGYNKLGTLTDDYINYLRRFSSKQMKINLWKLRSTCTSADEITKLQI